MALEIGTTAAIQTHSSIPREALKKWHFNFSVIDSRALLHESFALRYEVYCNERQFLSPENYPAKFETDEYDRNSIHVAGTNQDDLMVGTVRLVLPSTKGFPLFDHCEFFPEYQNLCDRLSNQTTAEISRLAISKMYRRRRTDDVYGVDTTDLDRADCSEANAQSLIPAQTQERRSKPEIVLGLYKAMYQASKRQGITHWFAAMERSLVRLLHRYHFNFTPIGPELDYFGPVVPHIAVISEIEESVCRNCPAVFAEFMQGLEPEFLPACATKMAD